MNWFEQPLYSCVECEYKIFAGKKYCEINNICLKRKLDYNTKSIENKLKEKLKKESDKNDF